MQKKHNSPGNSKGLPNCWHSCCLHHTKVETSVIMIVICIGVSFHTLNTVHVWNGFEQRKFSMQSTSTTTTTTTVLHMLISTPPTHT